MNKHTATLPNGEVVTRNSKNRVYSHVVAIQEPAAKLRSDCAKVIVYDERYAAECRANAERLRQGHGTDIKGRSFYLDRPGFAAINTPENYERWANDHAQDAAKRQAMLDADDFQDEEWGAAGWASRLDLAEKEAARYAKNGWRTQILKAEVK